MLISIKHKFVFICVPKCASTSIETALKQHANIVLGGVPRLKHTTYAEYRQYLLPFFAMKIGTSIESCQPVALFREPIDWLFSWYSFRSRTDLQNPDHQRHKQYA